MDNFIKKYAYTSIITVLVLGILIGLLTMRLIDKNITDIANESHPFREKSGNYAFINPLLFYEVPSSILSSEYQPLADKVQKLVNNFSKNERNSKISVYYRDLNEGRWIGINEENRYTPSSLLKVVVMIAYLKQAEIDKSILSRRIRFSNEIKNMIGTVPHDMGTELKLNKSYTVDELIDRMIVESDNGATYALLSSVDEYILDQVYADLGLQNPEKFGREFTISARDYAFFLRILYNATYLSRQMSERALSLLSKTDFRDGLVAGLPESITVSHKYGETVLTGDSDSILSVELHDCGIIYHPEKPYLLCIMTRGGDLDKLADIIKNISRAIYTDIDR